MLYPTSGMKRAQRGLTLIATLTMLVLLTGMVTPAPRPPSLFVTLGHKGEKLSGDECLARCVGCPFHDHRYFWKYSLQQPTVETDTKGIFPVIYGGQVISKLGDPRNGHRHMGIDIAAKTGAPVVAAWSGKVFFAGWNKLGGWVVIMKHKNGYVTYYAHLKDRPAVHAGQNVIAGQRLGALGMSGNARDTVPHLHFEVSKASGRLINPLHVL